jgi:hypothetical protein
MGSSVLQGLGYLQELHTGFVRVANSHMLANCEHCSVTLLLSSYVLTICATIYHSYVDLLPTRQKLIVT